MEPKFESKYTRTKELFTSYYLTHFFSPLNIALFLSGICLYVEILIFSYNIVYVFLMAVFLAVFALRFITCFANSKLVIKRDMEMNGGLPVEACVTLNDEKLDLTTPLSTLTFEYKNIKRIVENKKLIVLVTKANSAIVLPKDSFTLGTPDALLPFLEQKGIHRKKNVLKLIIFTVLLCLVVFLGSLLIFKNCFLPVIEKAESEQAELEYQQAIEKYEKDLNDTLAKTYDEYRLLDYFNVKNGETVVDVLCVVKTNDTIDILSYRNYGGELRCEKLFDVSEYGKKEYMDLGHYSGGTLEIISCYTEADLPDTYTLKREIDLGDRKLLLGITLK